MRNSFKKINNKWILLFLFGMFSVGMQGQYSENEALNDWITEALAIDKDSEMTVNNDGNLVSEIIYTDKEYEEYLERTDCENLCQEGHTDDPNIKGNIHVVETVIDLDPSWDDQYGDLIDAYGSYEPEDNWDEDDQFPPDDDDNTGGGSSDESTPDTDEPKPDDCPTACKKFYRVKKGTCDCKEVKVWYTDADGDGWYGKITTATDSPGPEWIDAKDIKPKGEDCNDGDEDITDACYKDWYYDFDGDGWHWTVKKSIKKPAGPYVETTLGSDNCDTTYDPVNSPPVYTNWYYDADGDGYHSSILDDEACNPGGEDQGSFYSKITKGLDCNDKDATKTTDCSKPDPCETLKKLNEDSKYKEKLAEVIEKAKTDSTKEYGYAIAKGSSDYVAGTNDADGNLDFFNKSQNYGFIHDHTLPRATVDANGNPGTTEYIQMFSLIDIGTFVDALNYTATNGVPISDVFSTLVDETGNVYTLKYEGAYSDIQGKSIDVAALKDAYRTNMNDAGISSYGGIENAFVAFLELDVKISGITIYRTTPGTTPTKLGITSDGVKFSPSNMPCK